MDMIQEINSQRAQIIITITIISNGFQTSLAIYPISSVPPAPPIQAHTHHPRGPLGHFLLLLLLQITISKSLLQKFQTY
jgi:hypothetical protein